MTAKRILISTHAPLDPIFGAAQMALNLDDALKRLGHDVKLWSPFPIPPSVRPRYHLLWMRKKFREFIQAQPPFDIVDIVPLLWNNALKRHKQTIVIARHVQPELLYRFLPADSAFPLSETKKMTEIISDTVTQVQRLEESFAILNGWKNANAILCLGSLDFEWMRRKFPYWSGKTFCYLNALAPQEQRLLSQVRSERRSPSGRGTKFLWIGRWSAHKGIRKLHEFIAHRLALNTEDTFTIAGCGEGAEAYFSPGSIEHRVFFVPRIDRNEIPSLLKNHDVGLFTSVVEGWGLSLNEMLESGMPVYATEAGGVCDLRKVIPELVLPFPPPDTPPSFTMPDQAAFDNYYQTFTWDNAALRFMEAASAVDQSRRQ